MNENNTLIPELRFPEFENDNTWEEKPLDEICTLVRGPFGGALKKEIFVNDGFAVYEQSHAIYSDFSSFRYRVNEEKYKELKRFSVKSGDLIMSCSGTMGKFAMIPKNYEHGIINQALLKLTVKKGYDNSFVKISLETEDNQNKLLSQSAGGAIKNVVAVSQIRELALVVPSSLEQQKIATCFSSLDEVIETNSLKLNLLKNHKKGLIQNLFPKKGKNIPNYRFPEFKEDEDWVTKTLDEIAEFSKGKGVSKSDVVDNGAIPCIRYGELYTHYKEVIYDVISYTDIPQEDLILSHANDVIIPSSGETHEDIATSSCVMVDGIALGGDLNIIRSKVNGVYLSYYLNNTKKREIAQMAQGISVVHLYSNQLKKLEITFPSLREQEKIGTFLHELDDVINDQSKKIDQLKLHKRGLMQSLFPKKND